MNQQPGHSTFFGCHCAQHPHDLEWFGHNLHRIDPDIIVCLGSGSGGFEALLTLYGDVTDTPVVCYDKIEPEEQYGNKIDWREGDIFEEHTHEEICDLLDPDVKALLLCDAVKVREFKVYAPLVSVGSVVGVHDYLDVAKPNGWLWHECDCRDIQGTLKKFGFEELPLYTKCGAWGMFERTSEGEK